MKLAEKKSNLAVYDAAFVGLVGKHVTISFDKHAFTIQLVEIRIATQKDIYNLPDKRSNGEKMYTPAILQLVFGGDETIDFVLEDIQSCTVIAQGVEIAIGDIKVRICES